MQTMVNPFCFCFRQRCPAGQDTGHIFQNIMFHTSPGAVPEPAAVI